MFVSPSGEVDLSSAKAEAQDATMTALGVVRRRADGELSADQQRATKRVKFSPGAQWMPIEIVLNILERVAAGGRRPVIWTRAETRKWSRGVTDLATISKASMRKLAP